MDWSIVLVSSAFGILGGAIGTYFSIYNTHGPAERSFMIRASLAVWLGVALFLTVLFSLPSPWKGASWLPYSIGLPFAIRYINRRQAAIRSAEGKASA